MAEASSSSSSSDEPSAAVAVAVAAGEVRRGSCSAKERLRRHLHATRPEDVLSDDNLEDVAVQACAPLNLRFSCTDRALASWSFEVATKNPKHLVNISLAHDVNRENFRITSIFGDYITTNNLNLQEFEIPEHQLIEAQNVNFYIIGIEFRTEHAGTFCQDVLFVFNQGAAIRRQLCVDVYQSEDLNRLVWAREYLLTLCHNTANDENTSIVPFTAVFGGDVNQKEKNLCKVYKKQDANNFFFTHSTLKSNALHPNTYNRKLHELIVIEELARREQISRYNAVASMKLSQELQLGKDETAYVKYASPGELFVQLPLGRDLSEDTKSGRLLLRSCNSLLLQEVIAGDGTRPGMALGREKYEALIVEKSSHSIYARLSKACVERFRLKPNGVVCMYVEYSMNRVPFCDWRRAVDLLPDSRLVFPEPRMNEQQASKMPRWSDKWNFKGCLLNEKQKQAVAAIMTPTDVVLPPVLILGPYGTGKTSTIAQALRILLTNDAKSKVLLCTHSNSAADLYIKEFFHLWFNETKDKRLVPIRIYYTGRMRNTVHPTVQKYCLFDTNGQFRDPSNEDLQVCRLVITTLGTSSCLGSLEFKPSHVIVDEAAQAFECEALTCLALASQHTRLVLAGDQMQLAPEVYSDLAREQGLGTSILERIHTTYEPEHPCRIQLCTNYRSHADIVRLTSKLFYKDQIKPGAQILGYSIYSPVTFFACAGVAVKVSDSTGYYNNQEAMEIADRVSELRENWPERIWGTFDENSICVLAHYAEQVFRIRNELRARGLANVSVERVLNVQGKQFAVVFVSVVRTRHCTRSATRGYRNDYGFLTDEKLMNTAITRAKHVVAVFGDPVGLATTGTCRKYWETYINKSSIFGMDIYDFSYHLMKAKDESDESDLNPQAREFVPRPNTTAEYPFWVENVAMPVTYPVMHCVFRPTPS